ncbi:hypothetical protein BCR44DRAFT_76327 [Catenaria anguillulae PL171]|uniref:RING-type domain-containing protein n=1 Tax=Catenaria anguillulae PL171 TaxID=765915 RepID=A0A1Y2HAG1_9FUNG|nr:hypothetical protein BCR44DRAFT_76327 [Catenaria anguillulae PL171]
MLKQPARQWIAKLPKAWEEEIDAGLHARFFIVHESGPLKFTLRDQDGATFRVTLGSVHSCSCRGTSDCGKHASSTSPTEEPLASVCKHIVWSLHRRLRIDQSSPLLFQTGLVEHELQQLSSSLSRKCNTPECPQPGTGKSKRQVAGVAQRPIEEEDVCPICQETFASSTIPLCYCKNSCGNNVHIPCMKLVAEHQSKLLGSDIISCPLCRSDFASLEELEELDKEWTQVKRTETLRKSRQNNRKRQLPPLHVGVHCRSCTKPIRGRRYRCSTCPDEYSLCSDCFQDETLHPEHPFQFKDNPKASFWTFAKRYVKPQLPERVIQELQSRDLSDQDYQSLLDLDSTKVIKGYSRLHVVGMFPLMRVKGMDRVRALLGSNHTETCHICLGAVCEGEVLRKLPCSHSKFHQDCVDRWLLTCSTKCPECDQQVICPVDDSEEHFIPADIDIDPDMACPWTRTLQYVAAERKRKGIDSLPRRNGQGGAGSPHERIVPRKAAAADAHRAVPAEDSRTHSTLPALFSSLLVVSSIGQADHAPDSNAATSYGSSGMVAAVGSGSIIRGGRAVKSSASRLSLPPLSATASTTSSARTRSSQISESGDLSLAGTPMQGSSRQDRKTMMQQNHPPRLCV